MLNEIEMWEALYRLAIVMMPIDGSGDLFDPVWAHLTGFSSNDMSWTEVCDYCERKLNELDE